jgi:hydrogenase/urease accessory protein HupE
MSHYFNFNRKIRPLSIIAFFALKIPVFAHTVNYALEGKPTSDVFSYYVKLGFEHIIPLGLDHILFVVGLYLLSPKLKNIIWQATAFTVAHTITLIMSMKNIIVAPPDIVEPIIALSIVFIAIENLITSTLQPWRIALVFAFGLVHGMGFASALNELGIPRDAFFSSLLSFNVGVELGQISVILLCYALFGRWFSEREWYKSRVVVPMSLAIAAIAVFWTVQRIWF